MKVSKEREMENSKRYSYEIEHGELPRLARKMQGIPQDNVAATGGISQSALFQLELKTSSLAFVIGVKIAPKLNIDPDFLWQTTTNPLKKKVCLSCM